ncbi:MAG TPA: zinc ribbon domain-containing protein [Planctomycetota bacterium]
MGLIEFTANHTDHSNSNGYQFEFHCDHCHNGVMTTFQTSKLGLAGGFLRAAGSLFGGVFDSAAHASDQVKDSLRGSARDDAFNKAVQEAKPQFKQCTRCGKWVCEAKCWNKKRNLCEACAPDLEEEAAAIQARVAVEQLEVKARASDQTGGLDVSKPLAVGECPHCGAKTGGGKFCPECGKATAQVKDRFCGECGAKIVGGAKFCPECGKPAQ